MSNVINKLLCSVLTAGAMIGAVGRAEAIKLRGNRADATNERVATVKNKSGRVSEALNNDPSAQAAYAVMDKYPEVRDAWSTLIKDSGFRNSIAGSANVDDAVIQNALAASTEHTSTEAAWDVLNKNPEVRNAIYVLMNNPTVRTVLKTRMTQSDKHTKYPLDKSSGRRTVRNTEYEDDEWYDDDELYEDDEWDEPDLWKKTKTVKKAKSGTKAKAAKKAKSGTKAKAVKKAKSAKKAKSGTQSKAKKKSKSRKKAAIGKKAKKGK